MSPERREEVERLYRSARERKGADRTAYLLQACAGNDALRRDVESLLAHDRLTHDGLADDGATQEFHLPPTDELPLIGRRVSHYLIVEEIGRGGMGIVYRGRDDRLRRDVAIKALSNAGINTAEERDRILHEARACCALNHAGIVTVHDVCEAESRLFIVMELVRGETVHEVISRGPLAACRRRRAVRLEAVTGSGAGLRHIVLASCTAISSRTVSGVIAAGRAGEAAGLRHRTAKPRSGVDDDANRSKARQSI